MQYIKRVKLYFIEWLLLPYGVNDVFRILQCGNWIYIALIITFLLFLVNFPFYELIIIIKYGDVDTILLPLFVGTMRLLLMGVAIDC